MRTPKEVGERLRNLRIARGLSQKQLAKRSQVHYTSISKIENATLRYISHTTMQKMCHGLGISFEELWPADRRFVSLKEFLRNPLVVEFLQHAQDMDLSEEEWDFLLRQVRRMRDHSVGRANLLRVPDRLEQRDG